jgi:hypothetical protein
MIFINNIFNQKKAIRKMQVLRNNLFFRPGESAEADDTLDAIQTNPGVHTVIQSRAYIISIIHRVNYKVEQYLHFSG